MNEQTDSSVGVAPRRNIKIFIIISSVLLVALFIAITLLGLLGSQQSRREISAIQTIKQIHDAQQKYARAKGGRYADLQTLSAEDLIDPTVALREIGYILTSAPVEGADKPMYDITARPSSAGIWGVGNRSFYSNETQVIYAVDGGIPPTATPQNRIPGKRKSYRIAGLVEEVVHLTSRCCNQTAKIILI